MIAYTVIRRLINPIASLRKGSAGRANNWQSLCFSAAVAEKSGEVADFARYDGMFNVEYAEGTVLPWNT